MSISSLNTLLATSLLLLSGLSSCANDAADKGNCASDRCDEGAQRLTVNVPNQERSLDILFLQNEAIVTTFQYEDNQELILTYRVPASKEVLRCACTLYQSSVFRLVHDFSLNTVDVEKARLGLLASVVPDPETSGSSQIGVNGETPQVGDFVGLYRELRAGSTPQADVDEAIELLDYIAETDFEAYLASQDPESQLALFWHKNEDLELVADLINTYVYLPITGVVEDDRD